MTADPLFRTIHRVLKPSGVLAAIDHQAVAGSANAAAQNLHRIEADFARADIEARGFKLAATSTLLSHDSLKPRQGRIAHQDRRFRGIGS